MTRVYFATDVIKLRKNLGSQKSEPKFFVMILRQYLKNGVKYAALLF
jgi:hypothetical protein